MSKSGSLIKRVLRSVDKFFSVDLYPDPKLVYSFKSEKDIKPWRVFTDAAFGGLSTASFELSPETKETAVFSGRYSKLVKDDSSLVRSGYCGINHVRPRNDLILTQFDYLDFRVKGDGHTYLANMRLDQLTGGDEEVWQVLLHTTPGMWEDVRLDFRDFQFTYKGRVMVGTVQAQRSAAVGAPRNNILAFGLTLAATEDMPDEGDFRLEVESVIAGAYRLTGEAAARKAFAGLYEFNRPLNEELDGVPRRKPPPISSYKDPRPQDSS